MQKVEERAEIEGQGREREKGRRGECRREREAERGTEKRTKEPAHSPMVVMCVLRTCPSVNCEMRQVFPTPLSPHSNTFKRQS